MIAVKFASGCSEIEKKKKHSPWLQYEHGSPGLLIRVIAAIPLSKSEQPVELFGLHDVPLLQVTRMLGSAQAW